MKVALLLGAAAVVALTVVFAMDAEAKRHKKQARLDTHQSVHQKVRQVPTRAYSQAELRRPARSSFAQAQLSPNGEPPNPAPLAYGSTLSWDRYGLRWD